MRRCPALLGLATSLAALIAVAIGPATATAGTPPAHTRTVAPHAAVPQPQVKCSRWTGVPDRRSNLQASACITVHTGDHPDIYGSVQVRNRSRIALGVSAYIRVGYGGDRTNAEKYCYSRVEPGETRECGINVPADLRRPVYARGHVISNRGSRDIWSPELH